MHVFSDIVTAFGTFITSFEELSLIQLDFSECSLVDSLSVLNDEGFGLGVVPRGHLSLDIIEVVDQVSPVAHGLVHVANCLGSGLVDSGNSANDSRSDY